jgi:DNA mismatch repair protein MutS
MRQFLDVKEKHPDGIVFFRLGDFYEMFYEDAVLAARALDLTLTTRDKGREDAVPMCGVPHHASRGYIARLTELGHKVVVCEQVEDPKVAKGIVRREVVRVVTPGVVLDEDVLDARAARYVAAIALGASGAGLAVLDVTTGEFRVTELRGDAALADEIARVEPREVLYPAGEDDVRIRRLAPRAALTAIEPCAAEDAVGLLAGLDVPDGIPLGVRAAADVLAYARATQPLGTVPVARLAVYRPEDTIVLDETTKTNLEVTETLMERKRHGSLIGVLDLCRTSPGSRLLGAWLLFPSTDLGIIRRRHDSVEHLVKHAAARGGLRETLGDLADVERIVGRITLGVATPRDLGVLRRTLDRVPAVVAELAATFSGTLATPDLLVPPEAELGAAAACAADIGRTLVDEPPAQLRSDGGRVVRAGCSNEIDELRVLADGGKDRVLAIEAREKERTGIASLKVRYNRVFGYYLEITRANLASVPDDYVRKQTLANAERYVTPELADLEAKILTAEDRLGALETQIFEELRRRIAGDAAHLQRVAAYLSTVDVCAALAEVAQRHAWVRPTVDHGELLEIEEGRHPVVEQMVAAGVFVPNDCRLDPSVAQLVVITGPNMAGKSTYMRQVAQIVLLAQAGAFVPAKRARVGVVDRIFTRVGAADNLARGESTFMVEMRETAHILSRATRRSLIILDEIGRGTSTYDGVSIAWAVAEHLHDVIGARALFATHYHELTSLSADRPRVVNVSVAVSERGGEVRFLRKVVAGGASRSYGIEVAKLAGLPRTVVGRARQLLAELEQGTVRSAAPPSGQLSLLTPPVRVPSAVEQALAELDPDRMTPLQALQALAELKAMVTPNAPGEPAQGLLTSRA